MLSFKKKIRSKTGIIPLHNPLDAVLPPTVVFVAEMVTEPAVGSVRQLLLFLFYFFLFKFWRQGLALECRVTSAHEPPALAPSIWDTACQGTVIFSWLDLQVTCLVSDPMGIRESARKHYLVGCTGLQGKQFPAHFAVHDQVLECTRFRFAINWLLSPLLIHALYFSK